MRKIAGVKTVRVSLNDGLTVLDFNASNSVTLAQLRTVLKNSGFVSKRRTSKRPARWLRTIRPFFTVAGTGEKFTVLPGVTDRRAFEDLKRRHRQVQLRCSSRRLRARRTTRRHL